MKAKDEVLLPPKSSNVGTLLSSMLAILSIYQQPKIVKQSIHAAAVLVAICIILNTITDSIGKSYFSEEEHF